MWKHPPGDEIYRKGSISVFEVDGKKNKVKSGDSTDVHSHISEEVSFVLRHLIKKTELFYWPKYAIFASLTVV